MKSLRNYPNLKQQLDRTKPFPGQSRTVLYFVIMAVLLLYVVITFIMNFRLFVQSKEYLALAVIVALMIWSFRSIYLSIKEVIDARNTWKSITDIDYMMMNADFLPERINESLFTHIALLVKKQYGTIAIKYEDIVWVYGKHTINRVFGKDTGTSSSIFVGTKDKKRYEVCRMEMSEAAEIFESFVNTLERHEVTPVLGYTPEIEKDFLNSTGLFSTKKTLDSITPSKSVTEINMYKPEVLRSASDTDKKSKPMDTAVKPLPKKEYSNVPDPVNSKKPEITNTVLPVSNKMEKNEESAKPSRRFCRFCGKPIPADADFCPKCGKVLRIITAEKKESHKPTKEELCKEKYDEALKLASTAEEENVHKAYDIMGGLASRDEYVPAMLWVGHYEEIVFRNNENAAYWYRNAADLGDGNGACKYADMLVVGRGVDRNPAEAKKYYQIAADKRVPEAMHVLSTYNIQE